MYAYTPTLDETHMLDKLKRVVNTYMRTYPEYRDVLVEHIDKRLLETVHEPKTYYLLQ